MTAKEYVGERNVSNPFYMKKPFFASFLWTQLWSLALLARADQVDAYINSEMTGRQIPGAALSIIQNGKTIKTAGYGLANIEFRAPVNPDTVFEVGSITKQFTAAGILLLAQEGKLSVGD